MPKRQETFTLVPTTLVNNTTPRPPMTSKAAKKAYREATKLPKLSKAELRRIEAAEIARQKKEYEKERAAAKAKTAREKRQQKEKEERDRRKKLGLPEPNRFVHASQPTIKLFVKHGVGGKRTWEQVDGMADENIEADEEEEEQEEEEGRETHGLHKQNLKSAEINQSQRLDAEDEFDDFPSLSQEDLPALFETIDRSQKCPQIIAVATERTNESSDERLCTTRLRTYDQQRVSSEEGHPLVKRARMDNIRPSSQVRGKTVNVIKQSDQILENEYPVLAKATPKHSHKKGHTRSATSSPLPQPQTGSKVSATVNTRGSGTLIKAGTSMLPPALPLQRIVVSNKASRMPLAELSGNKATTAPSAPQKAKQTDNPHFQNSSILPPSTQIFLEANIDNFFPSPSQQVRELMDDIDVIPSNTQVAREIEADWNSVTTQPQHASHQAHNEELLLHFFSSQDFVLSSQDLRDIDTPSMAVPPQIFSDKGILKESQSGPPPSSLGPPTHLTVVTQVAEVPDLTQLPPPAYPKTKPRFFEEKEEDLLHAALHESLVMARQKLQGSSPRRLKGILQRVQSTRTDYGDDDYGSDIDTEFLAALDTVERESSSGAYAFMDRRWT